MKSKLQILILAATTTILLFTIYGKYALFLIPYDHAYMGGVYGRSQYVKGSSAEVGIGDDWLFAVAGYYLFFQGGDPTQIHFESPPLGEYLIGLSILFFKNERVISIIYTLLLFIFTYKLATLLYKNNTIASMAVFLLSLEPLITNHIHVRLLDLPQALFVLIGVYFYIKALKTEQKLSFLISGFFLGAATSTCHPASISLKIGT